MSETKKDNTRRLAKNTMFLYFRSIFCLIVSLYSSRLFLAALGVDEEVLRAEHMNTNYFMEAKAQANYDKAYKYTHSKWIASEFYKYEGVQPGWLQIALNVIHRSGTIEDYLRDVIGLKDSDFQQLRDMYLEPVGAAALAPAA